MAIRTVFPPAHRLRELAAAAAPQIDTTAPRGLRTLGPVIPIPSQELLDALVPHITNHVREALDFDLQPPPVLLKMPAAMADHMLDCPRTKQHFPTMSPLKRSVLRTLMRLSLRNTMGVYSPSLESIYINHAKMRGRSCDAFRSVIFHELVHATQHQRNPEYFDYEEALIAKATKGGVGYKARAECRKHLDLISSLMEAEAYTMQAQIDERRYVHCYERGWPAPLELGVRTARALLTSHPYGEEVRAVARLQAQRDECAALTLRRLFSRPDLAQILFSKPRQAAWVAPQLHQPLPENSPWQALWVDEEARRPTGGGPVSVEP